MKDKVGLGSKGPFNAVFGVMKGNGMAADVGVHTALLLFINKKYARRVEQALCLGSYTFSTPMFLE